MEERGKESKSKCSPTNMNYDLSIQAQMVGMTNSKILYSELLTYI